MNHQNEVAFEQRAAQAIEALEKAYSALADDRDIDVQVEGGVLTITFEEGTPGKFIVSPNSSARQLWVSARLASFKFDWSDAEHSFVLHSAGESLSAVMTRLTREQLDDSSLQL
ncbi:MAG TPA: iron donor protein CyaY [Blastocatellia bacterium]|nr:iron donor protein CyaY [Blastocatellia bacterium]